MNPNKVGVLLTQIGTPEKPQTAAVRAYLKKFLSDPRVIELPRYLWWPILHGFILRFRPKRSAKLYQEIWTDEGSPLLLYSENIRQKLEKRLEIPVALGMHYSKPSIADALEKLRALQVTKIIVLPLFPQYSSTTTAASFDAVSQTLAKWRVYPEIQTIRQYHDHPLYIESLASSIRSSWEAKGQGDHLLFSFHGIPESYAKKGDPYPTLCRKTAELTAAQLQLSKKEWSISFQSRIGKTPWVTPYTETMLPLLANQGVSHLQVICPGFATDCLETLEEINIRGRSQFESLGGKTFHYIPALNDSPKHIDMLAKIISYDNV
jgi:ferrochelatase